MNDTIKKYLNRNGIDTNNLSASFEQNITVPIIYKPESIFYTARIKEKTENVCIADLGGSSVFEKSGDILSQISYFFDEQGDTYQTRSLGLLALSPDKIKNALEHSFKDDPIYLDEFDGKYYVSRNGNHRMFAMYLSYLIELQKATTQEQVEELRKKYTVQANVCHINKELTYTGFLALNKGIYVKNENDIERDLTPQEIVIKKIGEEGSHTISKEEFMQQAREGFILSFYSNKFDTIAELGDIPSFREYFAKLFPEIGIENVDAFFDRIKTDQQFGLETNYIGIKTIDDFKKCFGKYTQKSSQNIENFSKFLTKVITINKKMSELYTIMGMKFESPGNIHELGSSFRKLSDMVERQIDEAYKEKDKNKFWHASEMLDALSFISLNNASEYETAGMNQFKEKIGMKALQLKADLELSKLDMQIKAEEGKRIGFFGKLLGKDKLKDAKVENLRLRKRYVEKSSKSSSISMIDSVRDLYLYAQKSGINYETSDFLNHIKDLSDKTDIINWQHIQLPEGVDIPQYQLPTRRKRPSIKEQIGSLQKDSKMIQEDLRALDLKRNNFWEQLNLKTQKRSPTDILLGIVNQMDKVNRMSREPTRSIQQEHII